MQRQEKIAIVWDVTELAEAEEYGDFLTHPRGHYEVWEEWRERRKERTSQRVTSAFFLREYEDFPRGRVVYARITETFIVYADRRLQRVPVITDILTAFGLTAKRYVVRSDEHYR